MKYLTTHITDRADKSQMYYIQLSMLVESANCELRAAGVVMQDLPLSYIEVLLE